MVPDVLCTTLAVLENHQFVQCTDLASGLRGGGGENPTFENIGRLCISIGTAQQQATQQGHCCSPIFLVEAHTLAVLLH